MDNHTVRAPSHDEVALRWAEIEPLIRLATDRSDGCYEPIDILGLFMAGKMSIWIAETESRIDAAIVVSVIEYPRKRVLDIPLAGGRNMGGWITPLLAKLHTHGQEFNCAEMVIHGRRGWARAAGFEEKAAILTKRI